MLIRQIPADVHAVEFANNNATALIPRSGESGFASYLARAMETEAGAARRSDAPADEAQTQIVSYAPPEPAQPQSKAGSSAGSQGRVDPGASEEYQAESGSRSENAKDGTDPVTDARTLDGSVDEQSGSEKGRERKSDEPSGNQGSRKTSTEDSSSLSAEAARATKASKEFTEPTGKPGGVTPGEEALEKVVREGTANDESVKNPEPVLASGSLMDQIETDKSSKGEPRVRTGAKVSVTEKSQDSVTLEVTLPDVNRKDSESARSEESQSGLTSGREKTDRLSDDARLAHKAADRTNSLVDTTQKEAPKLAAGLDSRNVREKTGREARIEVADLRSAKEGAKAALAEQAGSQHSGSDAKDGSAKGDGGAELASVRGQASESSNTSISFGTRGENFSSRLSGGQSALQQAGAQLGRSLQEGLGSQIVRHARFVVRNNDSGSIRLNLRPEQLGTVRIALQMHDGHIAGRIIVDNQTVREAFEQNMSALERAFEESGLEMGQIDVTLADSQTQSEHAEQKNGGRAKSFGAAASVLAGSVPELNWIDDAHELVDVTV